MAVLQLFLPWAVLDACVIAIPRVPQSSLMLSIQHSLGLPLGLLSCALLQEVDLGVSTIIHSHNMAKVSQVALLYPVLYFLL